MVYGGLERQYLSDCLQHVVVFGRIYSPHPLATWIPYHAVD